MEFVNQVSMPIFMGMLGACFGSFLGLIIYRLPLGQSIVLPRSYCIYCHKKLKAWHNIPIISWFFLRGKCAYCSSPIGLRALVIEILCALCLVALYLKFGLSFALCEKFSFFFILIALAYIDIDYFSLPYSLLFALFFLGLLASYIYYLYPQLYFPLNSNLGLLKALVVRESAVYSLKSRMITSLLALIFFSVLNVFMSFILRKSGRLNGQQWAMGWGDPLLIAAIGLFVAGHLPLVIFLASFIGSIVGIVLLVAEKSQPKESDIPKGAVPFGPFLAIAAIFVYLF